MSDSAAAKNANAMLFGAAIGLAAGMLLAPKSGRENRERLMHEYGKTKDQLQRGSHDIVEKAKSTANKMKHKSEEKMDDMQSQDYPPTV